MVYHLEAKQYGCVLESAAENWIQNDKAEIHELTQFILDKDTKKEVDNQVFKINQEIDLLYEEHALDQIQLKKKYDQLYKDQDIIHKQDEKDLSLEFTLGGNMTKIEFSNKIKEIRKNHEIKKEQILEDKSQALEDLKTKFHTKMQIMASDYNANPQIKITWISENSKFQAASR